MSQNITQAIQDDSGLEQKADDQQLDDKVIVQKAKEGKPYLFKITEGSAAKFVKQRWDRMNKQARTIQNELRVNFLRYQGQPFAQVHPSDPNRIFMPNQAKTRLPPSINKIRRTVQRYVAQVTADDPILEGAPASHTDDARDAAEAATDALRGEWHRMNLSRKLQRAQETNAVMRSSFWFFEYDPIAGGKVPAQKYFTDPVNGRKSLEFVDSNGNKVDNPADAAKIWQGDMTCEVLFPMNVRWSGGSTLKEADEVFVGKVITLSQLYEMVPSAREQKLSTLVGHVTREHEQWFNEIRGAGGVATRNHALDDEDLEGTGATVTETSSLLDAPVMLINYYRKPSRAYPSGYHAMTAGEFLAHRGPLRYGVAPVAHFKCMDDLQDPLGFSLVDLLKDPQELLDFVNGQILRFLQSMKRRWFVPLTSGVSDQELQNPTASVIRYNANGGAPTAEQVMEIPATMTDWAERYDREFDDQSGLHDTMQGKHVPGVSSGRHAEALRSGDETILGLTRSMIQEGLEDAGEIQLAIIQKEWTSERKVSYFEDRMYMEKAFSNTDFGQTNKVRLKKGTLLMLTQAQKLESLFQYFEMQAITQQELRKLAPLADTAGISITEDPHYIKARRENERFLAGPTDKLKKAREVYEGEMEKVVGDIKYAERLAQAGGDEMAAQAAQVVAQRAQAEGAQVEAKWQEAVSVHAPMFEPWEGTMEISTIHFEEHTSVLARKKAENLPGWWVEIFALHTMSHLDAMQPPPEEGDVAPEQQVAA